MRKARRIKQLQLDNAQLRANLRRANSRVFQRARVNGELVDMCIVPVAGARRQPSSENVPTRRQAADATIHKLIPIWVRLYIAAILCLGIAVLSDRALNHPSWLDFARSHLYILLPASLVSRTGIR